MAAKAAPTIGGFQVEVVSDVPKATKQSRGIYGDLLNQVPTNPTKALRVDIGDAKKAATKITGIKSFLKRHNRTEEFTVVRRGSEIFISLSTPPEPEEGEGEE